MTSFIWYLVQYSNIAHHFRHNRLIFANFSGKAVFGILDVAPLQSTKFSRVIRRNTE